MLFRSENITANLDTLLRNGKLDVIIIALPFGDAAFDAVVSTFGVMFTPDQDRAAAEMIRVCRPGGKIGLANWTPDGFIGQVFKTIGKYLPPPQGVKSPALWGTEARIGEMFGKEAAAIAIVSSCVISILYERPLIRFGRKLS